MIRNDKCYNDDNNCINKDSEVNYNNTNNSNNNAKSNI